MIEVGGSEAARLACNQPWLKQRAQDSPDAVALEYAGRAITYRALDRDARRLARRLASAGLRRGDAVALLMPNGPDFVRLIHAAWYQELVLVLLNARLSIRELEFQLRDSGARVLVHGSDELELKAEAVARSLSALRRIAASELVELEPGVDSSRDTPAIEPGRDTATDDGDRPLVILYTSGTSGRPKGVVLSARNFLHSAEGARALLGSAVQARWLLCMPLFHVGGLSILFRSVLAGTTVLIHDRFDPAAVNRALDHEAVTGVSLVANMLQRVLAQRAGRPPPNALRFVLLGGGPASIALFEEAQSAGIRVAATYGLTEAASQVATRPPDSDVVPWDAGLVPLPGTELRIVADDGRVLPAGEEGEILVRGATVMQGYFRLEDESRHALSEGWLHTGDVGALAPDGSLRVFDRREDLIVSGGENVYPAEVEAVLLEHPSVAEAGVAGVADARFGSRPVAWLVARLAAEGAIDGAAQESSEALLEFCATRLARYKVPVRIHWLPSLPRTASGKLLRRDLREP